MKTEVQFIPRPNPLYLSVYYENKSFALITVDLYMKDGTYPPSDRKDLAKPVLLRDKNGFVNSQTLFLLAALETWMINFDSYKELKEALPESSLIDLADYWVYLDHGAKNENLPPLNIQSLPNWNAYNEYLFNGGQLEYEEWKKLNS